MNVPCRGCEDRQVGCHGKCQRYSEWVLQYRDEVFKKRVYLAKTDNRDGIRVTKSIDRVRMYGDEKTKHNIGAYKGAAYKGTRLRHS